MKSLLNTLICMCIFMGYVQSQDQLEYQKPPAEILSLANAPLAPRAMFDSDKNYMILLYRDAYKSIEELSETELRLAGLRIDPKTNIGSRTNYYNNVKIKNLKQANAATLEVSGLPNNLRMANLTWSPDQKQIAFTNTSPEGVSLWVLDIEKMSAKKLTEANLNANMGDVINWFEDNQSILVKTIPNSRKELIDEKSFIPVGPTISISDGKKAQNRTYQDLLKDKNDEFNFEQLAHSTIMKITTQNGKIEEWLPSAMYESISFSPDGEYVMVSSIHRPFSYLVPYYRFPSKTVIYDKQGQKIETVNEMPLIEDLPKGFMATMKGRRNLSWRSDKASTLVFAEALDEGDPEIEVEFRDEVFELEAPFNDTPRSLLKTINRFRYINWGNDSRAIAHDNWWNTRNVKSYIFNPSDSSQKPEILFDRNYQDSYSDPGYFVTERNAYGSYVLSMKDDQAYLLGDGYTEEGQFPFMDRLNLETKETERLYQSAYTDKLENIYDYDLAKDQLLVRIESKTEYPNYFLRSMKNDKMEQLTAFENPFKSIENAHKEVIQYKRDDGLDLSGTLYLPVGYNKDKKEKMPMIVWAYPEEYKDKSSAAQNTNNPNEFTYVGWYSPVYWVTRGYVVLVDASFPIVGEGETEPNDSFRSQLVANGKAAIDAVDAMGYIDRNRVAVGGHSYGAFMVANLLSHSDLFAAGIARSGAYNRTLTPFGFQSEERSYWDAPDVYNTMSPFMHADKMKTPLLLIHGEADNNSGTYPLQSERYFNALKGLGATVRLVMLPKESHGYVAKESIMHLLWEQDQWLEKYVKNKTEE